MMLELADEMMDDGTMAGRPFGRRIGRTALKVAQYGTLPGLVYTGGRALYRKRPRFLRDDDDMQLSRGGRGRERLRRIGQGIRKAGSVLLPVAGAALDFVPGGSAVKGGAKAINRLRNVRRAVDVGSRLIAVRQSAAPDVQQQAAEVNAEAQDTARMITPSEQTPASQPKGIMGIPPIALLGGAALLFLALKK